MIRHTFSLAPSVGKKREMDLWESGVRDWEDFLGADRVCAISDARKARCDLAIEHAMDLLKERDADGLNNILPRHDQWRIFGEFRDSAAYLDIETDGLDRDSLVTVVTVHKKNETVTLTHGRGLNSRSLSDALEGASMLVTFNGSCFDVPVLKNSFPGLNLNMPHLDLRFASLKVGLRGGLKNLEASLGITRGDNVIDVDGFEAVRLWRRWDRDGNLDALEKLIEYNKADTVNLEYITEIIYPKLVREHAGFIW
ncbi:MAG TPA: ribonuclease H-like domain-containing protein [Candidatus Methanomethylophilaceae archaeon]|nr:ribonuclease H-like domain-containing protein [Candidatus Methanomethylophilaceae archaeon]